MQFHHLTLEGARRDSFVQVLEAVHLGLRQVTPVVAALGLPDPSVQQATRTDRLVARLGARTGPAPQVNVAARWNHRLRPVQGDGALAVSCVVGAIGADADHRLLGRNLRQQLRPHAYIANGVAGDLTRPDLQRLRIDAQAHLALLAPALDPVLPALPLPLAQELYPGAVDQQLQGLRAAPIADLYLQRLLTPAHRVVVRYRPIQLCQPQRVLQGQPEQALDAPAELDRRVREGLVATALARGAQPATVSALRCRPSSFLCGTPCSIIVNFA